MGICYSSINWKRKTEWESGNDKADSKLKKSSSGDFATFISKLSGGGAAATAAVVAEERALQQIPGRLFSNGASRIASLYTQQGKKGTNQDAMIFWENFYMESDANATFCGVFDGHGPYGHMVARKVRDALPILLRSHWDRKPEIDQNVAHENVNFEGMRRFDDFMDEDGCESGEAEDIEKVPETHIPLKKSILKAFKLMDKELKLHPSIDCFCSGTTAVALIKQGHDLIIGNVGDSRAVLARRDKDNALVAVQLTVDLKPNLPREAARIQKCKGRVFALQDEPEVARVWLPNSDSPGLAMARAFGDFCLKDFGLISIPDVYHHHIADRDEFVILATDGVWDVLSNKEAVDIVASAPGRGTAARALVDCATRAWRLKYPTSKIDDCAVVCLFLEHTFVANVPKSQYDMANIPQTENAYRVEEKKVPQEEREKASSEVDSKNQNKEVWKTSSEVDSEKQNKEIEKASSEVDSENQNREVQEASSEVDSKNQNKEMEKASFEMDSKNQNKEVKKAPPEVDSENQSKEMEKAPPEVDFKNQNIIEPTASPGTTKESSEIVPVVEEVEEKPIETTLGQSKRSLAECLSTAEDEEWTALEGITRVNSLLSLPRFLSFDKRSTSWRKWL